MHYIALLFAGAFTCNCVPHLVCALKGEPFPTPFSTPRGVANSPPLLNLLWGFSNLLVGSALFAAFPVQVGFSVEFCIALTGAFLMGVYVSLHFGKVRASVHSK